MKLFIVVCLLISAVVAHPQGVVNSQPRTQDISPPVTGGLGTGRVDYGPRAYGPGLNNPYAFPPNQFQVQRALDIANKHQGLLVRVDVNGEVDLTDRFGREVEGVYDRFGYDLTELYDL